MAITEKSKVVILPEDFQEKRSLAPGAQVMTIGELRNMFVKPFNWNDFYSAAITGGDPSSVVTHNAIFGNFINANFAGVTLPEDLQMLSAITYNSDLNGANFSSAVFNSYYSNFEGCKLDGALFESVSIPITLISFSSAVGTSFISSNVGNGTDVVNVYSSDLTNANFENVVFTPSVKFTLCNMENINLNGATLYSSGDPDPLFFVNCTGLPDDPRQMGSFTFGTGFLYWPPTGTYFNEVFEELFCKTIIVDGVKFAGQNLTNKVFGFYDAGSIVPTVLRNCDFKDTFITMALNGDVALFNNCNFYGALNLTDDPNNNAMIGEVDGAVIRWIDGAYWSYIAEQGTWVKQ